LFLGGVPERFFKYWLPLVLWMALIFSASTGLGRPENTSRFIVPILRWLDPNMPEERIEKIHYAVRKTAHFVEYAVLGLLLWRFVYYNPALGTAQHWSFALALLLAALYASSDEFHQSFVAGRHASVYDVMLDTTGAGFALAALWMVRRLRHKT
jgi:VanZ family protein